MDVPLAEITVAQRLRKPRDEIIGPLAESMSARGLINPITVTYRDRRPVLVAGANRLRAANKLGWKTIPCTVVNAASTDAVKLIEIDENLIRDDLTPAERALHVAERKRIYEAAHPETRHGAVGRSGKRDAKFASFSEDTSIKTARGQRAIALDATRAKNIPQLARAIGTSLDRGEELDALAKLPVPQQSALIARAHAGEQVSARHAVKKHRRDEREVELAQNIARASTALGTKLYGVIYADPPWRFEPYSRDTGMDRAADNHYATMQEDELLAWAQKLPAARDCVLFLWRTAPMAELAHKIMAAAGFTYRSECVWGKDRLGTGYWFRNKHEVLMVGTRGNVPAPAPGEQFPSVIEAPVGRHSEKPDVFAEMIETMFPSVSRLEMFARRQRPGWDSWGNENEVAAQPSLL